MATRKYDDLTKEELVRLLQSRDRRDATRFGLVWEANEIERDKALNQDFVALDLDPELSCPKNAAAWKNLIIEGDNFDALRYLRMTFAGQVKCIYIDPPYNTGNKDFVYNDHFVDKEDLWRHSKWCEFMFQRLTLAKDLLRQDGVIFVSIDDNEVYHLGLLLQRVFGEGNFLANVIWQHSVQGKNDSKTLSLHHNYILAYSRSPMFQRRLVPRREEHNVNYSNSDNDPRGLWRSGDVRSPHLRENLRFDIKAPSGKKISPPPKGWRWSVETVAEKIATGEIVFSPDESRIIRKIYLEDQGGRVPESIWFGEDVGTTREASKEIKDILAGDANFDTPKPTRLLERILQVSGIDKDDLVVDFFAGSGTTAHAVHKLNKEDGGNRRVILVSSTEATVDDPDKNLCRDVCATRVRRVIEGYGDTPGLGGDFAYLRCRRIPAGHLTDIDHAQVWTALQLIHRPTLSAYVEAPLLAAGNEDDLLLYVPRFRKKDAAALRKAIHSSRAVIVYSWQPELIRREARGEVHVQIEAVPESLARRFGMRI